MSEAIKGYQLREWGSSLGFPQIVIIKQQWMLRTKEMHVINY